MTSASRCSRLLVLVAFSAIATIANAADEAVGLATYQSGAPIAAGQAIAAPVNGGVTRIALNGFARGWLDLRPGSRCTLSTEPGDKAGRERLVVQLDHGAARLDLTGTGPWQDVRVRGAALDITVTGTLFMVERVERDADHVSLIKGRLSVGLRRAVADALNQQRRVDLDSRQGVGGSTSGGLGEPTSVGTAPVLAPGSDEASDPGLTDVLEAFPEALDTDDATALNGGVAGDVADQAFSDVADDVGDSVLDELSDDGAVTDDILTTIGGGLELAGPPPPPF
ncbi:MAG: hypothetical protein H0X45_13725 [Planctomycetes bacterium]|nr:hypothetical protein [Planctomycetota bacterium]